MRRRHHTPNPSSGDQHQRPVSPTDEQHDLVFYLISRFVLAMLLVVLVESIMVWVLSVTMIPALSNMVDLQQVTQQLAHQETTSLIVLLSWVFLLLTSMGQANYLQMAGLARGSMTVALLLIMLVLIVLPPLVAGLAFSRAVVHKVRIMQEGRERELARIDEQRSRFITDIAHDLRTPLMAISGMAHALSDGVVREESQREEYLQSICEKSDKMSSLVTMVFDYTKLGSGTFSLDRKEVDLPQLLLGEAATAYADVEDAGMLFSIQVPEDRCMVEADPVQLARVVANLLSNAVRHNRAGTEIALLLVRRAGVAYVVVADTGEPISGDADALFNPFTRGDAARTDDGGSGLGLSICKRIADMHGYGLSLVQPYGRFAKAFVLRCTTLA